MSTAERVDSQSVVAVVLWHRGKIGLFKRSSKVGHDIGMWHCITGFLQPGVAALEQALQEVFEETGLTAAELEHVDEGPVLTLRGDGGTRWVVHTFRVETLKRKLSLNWEHDCYRWAKPTRVAGFTQVGWLADVLAALGTGHVARGIRTSDVI